MVDLKAVTAGLLGSYDARFSWNSAALSYDSIQPGSLVPLAVIPDTAGGGILRFSATDALGKGGSPALARLWFTATGVGTSNHALSLPTLATVVPLIDLTQGLVVAPGNITIVP